MYCSKKKKNLKKEKKAKKIKNIDCIIKQTTWSVTHRVHKLCIPISS